MLSSLIHLAPFAAILALAYVALSIHVVRYRYKHRLALGVAEDEGMQRAVRAHAQVAEYVPFSLLMIALYALCGGSALWVTVLGAALTIGRLAHMYSLLVAEPRTGRFRWRMFGMILTFTVLVAAAILLLLQWMTRYSGSI